MTSGPEGLFSFPEGLCFSVVCVCMCVCPSSLLQTVTTPPRLLYYPGLGAGAQASLRFQSFEGGSGPGGGDKV